MVMAKGAFIIKRGKFFVVNLVIERAGTRAFTSTPYGTYVTDKEARTKCAQINRVASCNPAALPHAKDCQLCKR